MKVKSKGKQMSKPLKIWCGNVSHRDQACPNCKETLSKIDIVWGGNALPVISYGEYIRGCYRRIGYSCRHCFDDALQHNIRKGTYIIAIRQGCNVPWLVNGQFAVVY